MSNNSDISIRLPLITIGITCHNASKTIKRTIESAINQNWPNSEILIVNDYSIDNSLKIIQEFLPHKKIKLINNPKNLGCAQSRNTLIKFANGEFIAFFDDDDFSLPDRLKLQYLKILSYESDFKTKLIACYASGRRIYPNGYTKFLNAVGSRNNSVIGKDMSDFLLFNRKRKDLFFGSGTPTCSLMARREVFLEVGNFDINLKRQEDIDFAIRLGFLGGHFIGINNNVLVQYFTESPNKSPIIELDNSLKILEKNSNYLKKNKVFNYMIIWNKFKYFHFSKKKFKAFFILFCLILQFPFRTLNHLYNSGISRLIHELRISKKK